MPLIVITELASAVLGDFKSEPRKRGSLLLIIIPPDLKPIWVSFALINQFQHRLEV